MTLTWWMHRRVDHDHVPLDRQVIQFDHTAPERISLWLVFDRGEPSVCVQHPGFEPDIIVTATTAALAEVFQGFDTWHRAVNDGRITVDGPPRLTRALPNWFAWSPFAADTLARKAREDALSA